MRLRLYSGLLTAAQLLISVGAISAYSQATPPPLEDWQVAGITAAIRDSVPQVRDAALSQIIAIPSSEWDRISRPLLAPLSSDLVALVKDQSIDPIFSVDNFSRRRHAITALGQIRAKEQIPFLLTLAEDKSDRNSLYRQDAVAALGQIQAKEQIPFLVVLAKDKSETADLQRTAVTALGQMQTKDQIPLLIALAKDKSQDYFVQRDAINALGQIQAKEQIPFLVTFAKDKTQDSYLRRDAVRALGQIQAKDQMPFLIALAEDKAQDIDLRRVAVGALGRIQAKEQIPFLVALAKNKSIEDSLLGADAVTALGQMQAKDQIPFLIALAKDKSVENYGARESAIKALGQIQAKDQIPFLIALAKNKAEDPFRRDDAVKALGQIQAKDQVPFLVELAKDKSTENSVGLRANAVNALGQIQAKDQIPFLIELLKDPSFSETAATALGYIGPVESSQMTSVAALYYFNHQKQGEARFQCHYLLGAAPEVELVLKRVMFIPGEGNPQPVPITSIEEARATLAAFHKVLPARFDNSGFAVESEQQILQIAHDWKNKWTPADRDLILSLSNQLSEAGGSTLRGQTQTPLWQTVVQKFWKIIAVQIAFWILLLYFYPTSPQVQAFFFWNRWARKFFGLGYVDLCLTWVPFLRNRLLAPFRDDLIVDTRLSKEEDNAYFKDIQVNQGDVSTPIATAIPEVVGQGILEGESGLGKSIFLRRLVNSSKGTNAYLPADSCDHGVFELIQRKLKGKAGDEDFIRSIIWSGGLSIVIDGLNEVSVETREKIRRFIDDFPKANVLLATQPILWKRPPKAKTFRLLPLTDDRIQSFLESRYPTFTQPTLTEAAYKTKCREYLNEVLGDAQSEEDRSAARLVLSNPMDLTTAAQILVSGDTPTLKNLQEQQFKRVEHDFKDTHAGQPFPLKQFSESVYDRLLRDDITLDSTQFFEPIQVLASHKMVIVQREVDAANNPVTRWVFRHDKIRDFFLVQAFGNQHEHRIAQHIDDPRFRGVYLMLATQLPLEQANELKDALVDHAAETKDHHLYDAVVEVLKGRKASLKPAPPETATA